MRISKIIIPVIALMLLLVSCRTKVVLDLAPAVTPDAKELTRISDDDLQNFYPALSPDGKKLMYSYNDQGKLRVVIRDLTTGKEKRILKYGYKNVFQGLSDAKIIPQGGLQQ